MEKLGDRLCMPICRSFSVLTTVTSSRLTTCRGSSHFCVDVNHRCARKPHARSLHARTSKQHHQHQHPCLRTFPAPNFYRWSQTMEWFGSACGSGIVTSFWSNHIFPQPTSNRRGAAGDIISGCNVSLVKTVQYSPPTASGSQRPPLHCRSHCATCCRYRCLRDTGAWSLGHVNVNARTPRGKGPSSP